MSSNRAWTNYAPTYRARDVKTVVDWLMGGMSGSVTGIPGVGKSNFLGFLCHRPDVIQALTAPHKIQVTLVPIDLNNLPDETTATFYRVILRSFYENSDTVDASLKKVIQTIYHENKGIRDPFLVQSALRDLLTQFRMQQQRVGFVFDRFDLFYQHATLNMTNALRGLRDSFKDMLFYVMGMRQEAAFLPDPSALGELYEIVDTRVCWIGPMDDADARALIAQETHFAEISPTEAAIQSFLQLSGSIPSLLKAISNWWSMSGYKLEPEAWAEILPDEPAIRYRLDEILAGLSQEEQLTLSELQKSGIAAHRQNAGHVSGQQKTRGVYKQLAQQPGQLNRLQEKGLVDRVQSVWSICSKLLALYVGQIQGRGLGRIWLDNESGNIYQGKQMLTELSPLEKGVLRYMVKFPRIQHTKTDLIINGWPAELRKQGITDDSLYQVIAGLRKKIEPVPAKPCYLLNWRGHPEGGYQLFPEGRPA